MNRPRKSKGPYPPCFYAKHGAFYLVRANKWTRLGTDLGLALLEYGRLMQAGKVGAMAKLIDTVLSDCSPRLASTTVEQYTYAAEVLKRKLKAFEPHEVKSKHVAAIKQSMADKPNMANRVISFLRKVFEYAVDRQMVDTNPCVGVRRLAEAKRKRLLTETEWRAIHDKAGPRLKVIMQLQFLTGQRINDVLKIRRSQLTEEGITFKQQKTDAKLTVKWSPDLRAAVAAANALTGGVPTLTLLRSSTGKAPDYRSVQEQWRRACELAGIPDAKLNDGRLSSRSTQLGAGAGALPAHAGAWVAPTGPAAWRGRDSPRPITMRGWLRNPPDLPDSSPSATIGPRRKPAWAVVTDAAQTREVKCIAAVYVSGTFTQRTPIRQGTRL